MNTEMENNLFENLMTKLPCHVIFQNIIPYTYSPQSKELCRDIQSFCNTKNKLYDIYECRWGHIDDESEIAWLENDMIRFMNDDIATMLGYTVNHVNRFRRLFQFSDKSDGVIIDAMVKIHRNKYGKYQNDYIIRCVSCMLGVLTCDERVKLMSFLNDVVQ